MGITTLSVGIVCIMLGLIGIRFIAELVKVIYEFIFAVIGFGFRLVVVAAVCVVCYGCYLGYNFVF